MILPWLKWQSVSVNLHSISLFEKEEKTHVILATSSDIFPKCWKKPQIKKMFVFCWNDLLPWSCNTAKTFEIFWARACSHSRVERPHKRAELKSVCFFVTISVVFYQASQVPLHCEISRYRKFTKTFYFLLSRAERARENLKTLLTTWLILAQQRRVGCFTVVSDELRL